MKTSRQLLYTILGLTICLASTASAEPQNDEAVKRPMQDFRRGGGDGPRGERGKGNGSHRGHRPDGRLMMRIHNAADKDKDGKLDPSEKEEFDRLVSEAKRRMHKEILARFDADGDGKLSDEEKATARAAGRKNMEALRKEAIERFDKDGDGELNAAERQEARQALRKRMMNRAKEFDTNGDGILDDTERAAAREAIGKRRGDSKPQQRRRFRSNSQRDSPTSPQGGSNRGEEMRKRFDTNKDGKLDDAERQSMRETIRNERASKAE